jgi:hypothetical protein
VEESKSSLAHSRALKYYLLLMSSLSITSAMTAQAQDSLIGVLDACDNFRPHLSREPLVPFLLAPEIRSALGLLRPCVVIALIADNAWRNAHGHPLAWDIPASGTGTDAPPYIAFAPALARGSPSARTIAFAETLERWRAAVNAGDADAEGGVSGAFVDVIGGARWRAELYDVYAAPGSWLRVDGHDPLTLLGASSSSSLGSVDGYVFSMERAACKLFGVVTYGVHMTVYEGDVDADANAVRVWVPRRAATKPTCVLYLSFRGFFFFKVSLALARGGGAVSLKATPVCSTTRSRAASQVVRPRSTRSLKKQRKRQAWIPNWCGSARAESAP